MFILDEGTRVVVPRTELTYPGHNMKLHTNAASAEKTPVDHVKHCIDIVNNFKN